MPSGYTARLYDGEQTFEDFIIGCAHAFSVDMRDMPVGEPIPAPVVDDGYRRRLDAALARREELREFGFDRWAEERDRAHREYVESTNRMRGQYALRRVRYQAMLERVAAWDPPTEDHVGLRDFMREQLTSSLRFDAPEVRPPVESPDEWATVPDHARATLGEADRAVWRATDDLRKAEQRAAANAAWVQALYDSLGVTA